MISSFAFWLHGIVEDDPLPDEIKNIVFVIKQNGEYSYLELRGYETLSINTIFYRPLEAEFFDLMGIYHMSNKVFLHRIKSMIDEAFSMEELKVQFAKRNIYLIIGDGVEYLFTIN